MHFFIYLIFILCTFSLYADSLPDISAYELSEESTIRKKLDKIFSKPGVLSSYKAFRKRGFRKIFKCKEGMFVAKHPKLKGVLIKTYQDSFKGDEWKPFITRINGANLVKSSIQAHHFEHLLKVPKKWLYRIPATAKSPRKTLLVVEDMETYGWTVNLCCFKTLMTRDHLLALYIIISENQLIDSVYPDNIPFSYDECLNFVDIEHFQCKNQKIMYEKLTPFLSPELQIYWRYLTTE